jgi:hypothetical protein
LADIGHLQPAAKQSRNRAKYAAPAITGGKLPDIAATLHVYIRDLHRAL